jgi:hypothetical protein
MNSDSARFATAAGHSALRLWADLVEPDWPAGGLGES